MKNFFEIIVAINVIFVIVVIAKGYLNKLVVLLTTIRHSDFSHYRYLGGAITEIYEGDASLLFHLPSNFGASISSLSLTAEEVRRNKEFLLYVSDGLFFFYLRYSRQGEERIELSCASAGQEGKLSISPVERGELKGYQEKIRVAINPISNRLPSICWS